MTQADEKGVVSGNFSVPPNIPVGTKSVIFVGETGSRAQTTYTGRGNITIEELRNVTSITTRRFDPLAQTFTLSESRLLAGVHLWFTKKGEADVRVQIRETDTGLPNQTILCETIKKSEEIEIDGTQVEFRFDPIFAAAGVEYAIVVLTDDPDFEVRIAEIGEFDSQRGWLTRQPYQVGVLLSSSNAQTWTPHQGMDLTFRLLAARFINTERIIQCGTGTFQEVSDLMPLASVERTSSETDIRFIIADNQNNKRFEIQDNQVLNLTERLNGEFQVEAHLRGSEKFSPVLFPGAQLARGQLQETADYVSRAIPCGDNSNLKVCFEGLFSGQAGIDVYRDTGADGWEKMTLTTGEPVEDNWVEQTYRETGLNQNTVRIKLILKGNVKDRPRVRKLRVITT